MTEGIRERKMMNDEWYIVIEVRFREERNDNGNKEEWCNDNGKAGVCRELTSCKIRR